MEDPGPLDTVDERAGSPPPGEDADVSPESPVAVVESTTKDDAESPTTEKKSKKVSKTKEELWEEKQQNIPKVVDVKWLDFEHFKNRYHPDEGLEIIEVLRGHQYLASEITKEQQRRRYLKKWDVRSMKSRVDSDSTWIQRVRIQSPQIMLLLSRLTGHDDTWSYNKPQVFFRPFRTFYYFLPQVKRCLKILEKRWGKADAEGGVIKVATDEGTQAKSDVDPKTEGVVEDESRQDDTGDISDADDEDSFARKNDTAPVDPEDAVAGEITDSVTGLRHVRKYVQFIEENIMPLWEKAATTTHRKVRFLDLWMYFIPGELLYVPPKTDSSQSTGVKMYQTAWRLYSKTLDTILDDNPDDWQPNAARQLDLIAYYIDYNGFSYGPVEHTYELKYYEGERDITTLEIYPMRFVKDAEKMKAKLYDQGKTFQKVITEKHLYYDGWTLTHGPTGDPDSESSEKSENRSNPEHIDGDVIIDFVEGYKARSSIKMPTFLDSSLDDSDWPTGDDALLIQCWKNGPRSELLGEVKEIMQRNELVGNYLKSRHKKQSKLLQTWETTNVTQLEGDDLALLPRRAVAYAFRERKFVMVDIQALKNVPPPQNVFGDLKIDDEHKRMVKSLVKSHFRKQKLQKQQPSAGLNQDLIRGKGSGLFILLHGVPGVGKTATAEAVAQANKKPLFVITCGDLGFSPKEVDNSLRDIFRLAHLWDCVLLLDEADIFLTRREHNDLKRNALVSVFLRVLEYYSGILFLTTNRVGILDEAFKSRIHVSLYYPPLSKEQTLAIFDVNIRKLYDIEKEKGRLQIDVNPEAPRRPALIIDKPTIRDYAEWHYDNHEPHQRWNGRQIRNAFQIAYSLADFDMQRTSLDNWDDDDADIDANAETPRAENGKQAASRLDYRHFKIVAKAIEKFDRYLFDAMQGATDTDNARNNGTRDDDHDENMWNQGAVYYPPSPRPQRQNPGIPRRSQQDFNGNSRGSGRPRGEYNGQGSGQRQRPQQQDYNPPAQEYQPPKQGSQPRPRQRPVPQDIAQSDNGRLRARGSPAKVTPRAKPPLDRKYDSGYSTGPSVPPNDDYAPDEELSGEYQDYADGGDPYYEEYEEDEHQSDGRL